MNPLRTLQTKNHQRLRLYSVNLHDSGTQSTINVLLPKPRSATETYAVFDEF